MLRIRDLYNITYGPIYWRTWVWENKLCLLGMFLDELISRKLITLRVYKCYVIFTF